MTAQLAPLAVQKFFDNNGFPLAFGQLFTYAAGTTTPQATYVDSTQTTQNTNPIQLNFRGECNLWLDPTKSYKFLLQDLLGNTVPGWPIDNIAIGNANPTYNIIPGTDNLYTLGSSSFAWANVYVGANHAPVLDTTSGNIGYYARTAAEVAASITPTSFVWLEGDIRRYSASTSATDNSAAINAALSVSASGGRAAYIPAGTWKITSALSAVPESSMVGDGAVSIIAPQSCDGIHFPLDAAPNPVRRVFRDFAVIGSATTSNNGLYCNVAPSAAWNISFEALHVANFGAGVYAQGFRVCSFLGCTIWNCYYGFYFIGQSTNIEIVGCHVIRQTITGTGGSWGISFQQSGGLTTESVQVVDTYIYNFDIGIKSVLAFEVQIVSCDIANCNVKGIESTSNIGGFWVQDCEIQVINGTATNGIDILNTSPNVVNNTWICNNYITCDTVIAGSIGIHVGNSNHGAVVENNHVVGFDQGILLGGSNALIVRGNTVSITQGSYGQNTAYSSSSFAIQCNSLAIDPEIGPNYIVPDTLQACTMTNGSSQLDVTPTYFPVGSPVQFDVTANGFFAGVTYYVTGVGGNWIAVSGIPGGANITATGNTAINVFQAPLPVTFTAGTPAGFNFHARGSFLGTLTGLTTSPNGPVDWLATGRICSFNVRASASLSGTSNSTSMSMTGVPSFLLPLTVQNLLAQVEDNGSFFFGLAQMGPGGAFNIFKGPGGTAFTNVGTKSLQSLPMTYTFT